MQLRYALVHRILCWCLALLNDYCESLRDVRVSVPQAIRKGGTAVFRCDFDLEDEDLYAVKWYYGRKEFYRFTPKDETPIKTFDVENIKIKVDISKSNMTRLTLVGVEPEVSGVYNCEVSAESPSFSTQLQSGEMTVVELPADIPKLMVLQGKYKVGDILEGNCTSKGSRPAANLTWSINGEKVLANYVTTNQSRWRKDTMQTHSALMLMVTSHHFRGGLLHLKCEATIHNVYHAEVETRIKELRSSLMPEVFQNTDPQRIGKSEDESIHNKRQNGPDFTRPPNHQSKTSPSTSLFVSLLLITTTMR